MNRLKLIVMPGLALALILSAGAASAEPVSHRTITVGQSVDVPHTAHRGYNRRDHDRDRHPRYRDRRHERDHDRFHRYRFHRHHDGHHRGFGRDHRFAGGWWPHYSAHGFRHRYFHGSHYYYNRFGFYFPDYGFIHYGHRHGGHCPTWHFRSFAAGAVLGAVINH